MNLNELEARLNILVNEICHLINYGDFYKLSDLIDEIKRIQTEIDKLKNEHPNN